MDVASWYAESPPVLCSGHAVQKRESYVSEILHCDCMQTCTELGVCSDTGTRSVVRIVHFGAC